MPSLLRELYPYRAQLACALERGAARLDGQTLATYTALQAQIRALEQALPARWSPPAAVLADWCCPRVAGETWQGPACCSVCDGDEAARAAMWAVLGEGTRGHTP